MEVDGQTLLAKRYAPGGLRGDGPTFAYEELPVRPGPHVLEVLLADGTMEPSAGPAGRQWRLRQELDIARGEAALVEFSEDAGLGVRGARPPATLPESRHGRGRGSR